VSVVCILAVLLWPFEPLFIETLIGCFGVYVSENPDLEERFTSVSDAVYWPIGTDSEWISEWSFFYNLLVNASSHGTISILGIVKIFAYVFISGHRNLALFVGLKHIVHAALCVFFVWGPNASAGNDSNAYIWALTVTLACVHGAQFCALVWVGTQQITPVQMAAFCVACFLGSFVIYDESHNIETFWQQLQHFNHIIKLDVLLMAKLLFDWAYTKLAPSRPPPNPPLPAVASGWVSLAPRTRASAPDPPVAPPLSCSVSSSECAEQSEPSVPSTQVCSSSSSSASPRRSVSPSDADKRLAAMQQEINQRLRMLQQERDFRIKGHMATLLDQSP
jgi:hypothetical protein